MATRRGPDNSVRFSIAGAANGVNYANVFWANLTTSTTPTQADLDAWLTAASNAYKTRFTAQIDTSIAWTQAQAILFLPGTLSLPSLVPMTGSATGAHVAGTSQSMCSVLSWQTGVYWRGGKPRTYLPFPPASIILNDRSLTAAGITALGTAAAGFRTDVNALTSGAISGTQMGFVSFRTGNADRVPPVFFPYLSVKVHPRLGTQRRRLGRWAP